MNLAQWAARWSIPQAAFDELVALSIVEPADDYVAKGKSEAYVQSTVRLEAPAKGVYLWRNQVGAGVVANVKQLCPECYQKARRPIRWGLANDSPRINEVMKSGDLIGGRPRIITADMVGFKILQFVSRECKHEGWVYSGDPHEQAQLAWATLINSLGGDAAIVSSTGSL